MVAPNVGASAAASGDPTMRAAMVRHMAETGEGTDECLRQGCLPMRVHFYSPVPDIGDLAARKVWSRKSELPGINFRRDAQLALLAALGRELGMECQWPHAPTGDDTEFHTDNSGFSYGCAAATHMLIRRFKPRRVIEVGSGSSSRVIASALLRNAAEGAPPAEYIVVDPYPMEPLRQVPGITRIVQDRIELVALGLFEQLRENDVLFVDSGHTVRIGGDVNFLILDVLPRLAPGVLAHFHDIPMPYEYAEVYFTNPKFRMFWTESYLLQAFLAHNSAYEILLAMNFLMLDHPQEFCTALPHYRPDVHKYPSHSFWIRRGQ
jgi:hypothetical protein